MQHTPMPHGIYKHFKGNLYQVITVAEHSETGEQLVIYQALYGDFRIYARPLAMFMGKVDRDKYPGAPQEYRFEVVDMGKNPAHTAAHAGADSAITGDFGEDVSPGPAENSATAERAGEDISPKPMENSAATEDAGELNPDPMILEFLDASTYEERLNILAALHHRITDDMINVMAMATDIEVKPGDVEERYAELRACLLKLEKFECNRLR